MSEWIPRPQLAAKIEHLLGTNPIVLLLGPRQCGKTTLARRIVSQQEAEFFDLEHPDAQNRLAQPMTAL